MAIVVVRKSNENPDQLLIRFNKSSNRFVKKLRRSKAFKRNDSFFKRKVGAVIREQYRAERKRKQYYA